MITVSEKCAAVEARGWSWMGKMNAIQILLFILLWTTRGLSTDLGWTMRSLRFISLGSGVSRSCQVVKD